MLARSRRLVEAEDLHGSAGARILHFVAAEVEERAHLAPGVARDDCVAHLERAACDEHRRDGAAADVEPALDDRTRGFRLRIGLELELGVRDEQDLLEQVTDSLAGLGGNVGELGRSAPLLGLETVGHQLLSDLLRVGLGLVDLVDGDEDRHLCGARMVDGLDGLRHDAVVRGHYQDGDVRHLGAAGAQGREGFMARRIEEGDAAAAVVDLVSADVLGDPAGLGLDHGALPDGVEERGLAVVDVPHDRDHRWPARQVGRVVLVGFRLELLLIRVLDLDFLLRPRSRSARWPRPRATA